MARSGREPCRCFPKTAAKGWWRTLRCPGQTRGIAVEPAATEFSWILEDNKPSLEGAHAIGAQLDKLYRIYTKPL
jgi:hypothetical protein